MVPPPTQDKAPALTERDRYAMRLELAGGVRPLCGGIEAYQEDVTKLRAIIHEVCEARGLKIAQVLSRSRARELFLARQEIYWRAREDTALSFPQIGAHLGLHHTTILSGARRHARRVSRETTELTGMGVECGAT